MAPPRFLPQAKSSHEGIGVVARSAPWRELFQLLDVASAHNHVLRFQSSHKAGYDVCYQLPPFLFAQPLVSADPDIVFEGAPFVRQMAKLHGLHDAVHDHGGTEPSPQSQEQHLATLVAPEGLHHGIIHQKRREAPAFMPGMDRRWARRAQCPRAQQDLRSTRALNGRGHCIGGSPGIHAGEDVPQLHQAIQTYKDTHPEEDFALLHHHQQTLLRRLQALFFAARFGIKTLTGFDTHAPPLPTLVGRGYHSSTLLQCLGQLERVAAAPALLPTLVPVQPGPITSVDGPMIAYGSRWSMHKGKSTMLGRIRGGSQAVSAHDTAGYAVFVPYDPPALQLSQLIVADGQKVAVAPGNALFVIDRAVNAVALA